MSTRLSQTHTERKNAMSEIIISYREHDTQAQAERLRDVLDSRFGAAVVQLGVTAAAPPGENPRAAIAAEIPQCKALIVLVGRQWWLEEWLGDPADFDRRAIAVALREKRLIIPVLVDGATLPAGDHPILAALARRGGVPLDTATFAHDAAEIAEIACVRPGARHPPRRGRPRIRQCDGHRGLDHAGDAGGRRDPPENAEIYPGPLRADIVLVLAAVRDHLLQFRFTAGDDCHHQRL